MPNTVFLRSQTFTQASALLRRRHFLAPVFLPGSLRAVQHDGDLLLSACEGGGRTGLRCGAAWGVGRRRLWRAEARTVEISQAHLYLAFAASDIARHSAPSALPSCTQSIKHHDDICS